MKLDTLQKLYTDELRDLYNAENQLLKALPKMAKAASSEDLKEAFEKHLEQTKGHVERLEQVCCGITKLPVMAVFALLPICSVKIKPRSFCKLLWMKNPKQTRF
jgi:Domain of unknown function (DUF892)